MPEWVEPMAATLTDKRFNDPGWTFERKLDGIRVLAYKNGKKVELWSRNRLPLTANYPAAVEAIGKLPVDSVILDGEAAWAWGRLGKADYFPYQESEDIFRELCAASRGAPIDYSGMSYSKIERGTSGSAPMLEWSAGTGPG